MAGAPPDGEPAPCDGALPGSAYEGVAARAFGVYLHVPYCATRCGYCDFNTYTAAELGGSASQATYADQAVAEIRFARRVLGAAVRPATTVFVGGGTPTLLPSRDLARMVGSVREEFGLTSDVEITTEANPDSVTPRSLAELREAGFTRISFGMQSAVAHVLATLDRTHTAGRAVAAVDEARAAGFEHINLDLIYGTPGESEGDWEVSLDRALEAAPDHVSAYALIVEDATRLAASVRRGTIAAPADDDLADKYLMADERLSVAGLSWYEISNWARDADGRSRHNQLYWTGGDWWGIGPGAHSHIGGTRWWNVRHPSEYGARVEAGLSPAQAREVLDGATRRTERVLLEIRTVDGLPLSVLGLGAQASAAPLVEDGLLDAGALDSGRAVLTLKGRLLADAVVRALV